MSVLVAEQRLEAVRFEVFQEVPIDLHADPQRYAGYLFAGQAKYGEPFFIAELEKIRLRREYCARVAREGHLPFHEDKMRSDEFWMEYEEINRLWLPEDPVYAGTRPGVALTTTADPFTSKAGASGQHRILEIFMGGEATVSAVARVALNRPGTNGVTATNQTPEKMNTRSPAAVSTFVTGWTTQPVRSTNDLILLAFNAFGGGDRFVPQPGAEIYAVNSEELSCRSLSGTSTVSTHVHWEEL